MKILKINEENYNETIQEAINVIKSGGTVIYPTETCYGIGVDVLNQDAVDKLYKYKGFRGQKPFSMAVTDIEMAKKYVNINDIALNVYNNYLPGPVTVVSESKGVVAKGVESEWKTVGVRIPDHKVPIDIVNGLGTPITATSANVSYKPVAYSIESLLKHTPKKSEQYIDLIIDYGELPKNIPSTVLDTTMNSLQVLRDGKIEFEDAIKKSKLIEEIITNTPEETIQSAKNICKKIIDNHDNGSLIFALSGELGAGKTQFTKGLGELLNVVDIVNSPTYTIINEYLYNDGIDRKLIHMDTWRLSDKNEFLNSGLQEYLVNNDIISIEWADKYYNDLENLVKELGGKIYKVSFEYIDINTRRIKVYESN